MHQIFYIDIDEEITSIIDRLKKSKFNDIYFVAPKYSLILQSVVSLKLLKREGMRLKKRVTLITQDQTGKTRAERSGLKVLANTEGLEDSPTVMKIDDKKNIEPVMVEQNKKVHRLSKLGSESFFGNNHSLPSFSVSNTAGSFRKEGRNHFNEDISVKKKEKIQKEKKYLLDKNVKDNQLEEIFNPSFKNLKTGKEYSEKKHINQASISGRMKKNIAVFFVLSSLIFFGIGIFIFVPKASITVGLKASEKDMNFSLTGDAGEGDFSADDFKISSRIIEVRESVSREFPVTGLGTSSGQKAKGTIMIHNEFSSSPQPLVATTRFITGDGKVFRLVKGVTVPGMADIDGKKQPGVIEVDVVADQFGEEYNIEPSVFNIPGFQGGPKYEKIYARSSRAMIGGLSGSATLNIASIDDIGKAKIDVEKELREILENKIKNELVNGDKLFLEDISFSIEDSRSVANNSSGKFNYQSSGKITAFVVSEEDIKIFARKKFAGESGGEFLIKELKINYNQFRSDFKNRKLFFDVDIKFIFEYEFDREKFKELSLGKNEEQMKELLSQYPQIENIDIKFWPGFLIKKVPSISHRVFVEVR